MFWFEVPALKTFLKQTSLGRVRAANPLLELPLMNYLHKDPNVNGYHSMLQYVVVCCNM